MQAIETTLKNEATRTHDLGGKADTATCGRAVAAALDQPQGRSSRRRIFGKRRCRSPKTSIWVVHYCLGESAPQLQEMK